jgi:hypothetical protein
MRISASSSNRRAAHEVTNDTTTDDRFHDTITMIGGLRFTPFG